MTYRNTLGRCLVTLACLISPWAQAATTVVTFEDLSSGLISDGYGGIAGWELAGGSVRENLWIPGGQGRFGYSGFNSAPDDGVGVDDDQAGLHFTGGPVVFEGAYFFNADVPAGVHTGILLYYQGQLVHRIDDPMQGELTWVTSGYHGLVDTLYFAAGYDGFLIDNLTYSTPSPVPEPGAALMLGSGLTVMGGLWRRQRKAASAQDAA
jgi:hypothetical protein